MTGEMIGAALLVATLGFTSLADEPDACAALAQVSLARADCYAQARRWREAEGVYREFRTAHRDSMAAALGHAEVLFHLNHVVEAAQIVRRLAESRPDEPAVLKLQAWMVQNVEKDPPSAGALLEKLTRISPVDADAWRLLGSFYLGARAARTMPFNASRGQSLSTPQDRFIGPGWAVPMPRRDAMRRHPLPSNRRLPRRTAAAILWFSCGTATSCLPLVGSRKA